MKNLLSVMAVLLVGLGCLAGCKDSAVSRDVKPEEVEESNARRQDYVDSLDIPEEQKQRMREQYGGGNGQYREVNDVSN